MGRKLSPRRAEQWRGHYTLSTPEGGIGSLVKNSRFESAPDRTCQDPGTRPLARHNRVRADLSLGTTTPEKTKKRLEGGHTGSLAKQTRPRAGRGLDGKSRMTYARLGLAADRIAGTCVKPFAWEWHSKAGKAVGGNQLGGLAMDLDGQSSTSFAAGVEHDRCAGKSGCVGGPEGSPPSAGFARRRPSRKAKSFDGLDGLLEHHWPSMGMNGSGPWDVRSCAGTSPRGRRRFGFAALRSSIWACQKDVFAPPALESPRRFRR